MTADREWLLKDSMRLEDAEPDHLKPLWIVGVREPEGERVLIVEALTAPGARAIGETLGLLGADDSIYLAGPLARSVWPESFWYRWLTEQDVADFLSSYLPPELREVSS